MRWMLLNLLLLLLYHIEMKESTSIADAGAELESFVVVDDDGVRADYCVVDSVLFLIYYSLMMTKTKIALVGHT